MNLLHCQQVHKVRKVQIKKLRSILHANRKQGHRLIINKDAPPQRLDSVQDMPSGKIFTDRVDVKRAVQDYSVSLMQKPKQGDTDLGAMPWEERGKKGLDPFELQQGQHGPASCPDEQDMLLQMDDVGVFQGLLNHLARGKAAGPDGVPNELLQALPCKLQEAIRRLFVVMWLSGHTSDDWKVSKTILLYKKGDPLHLQSWRPIALANTLYKTWTSMVTHVRLTYGERQGIIGSAQEGFRRYRNTSRQLRMAILMIDDAALYHQDLYSLYIDFSSAFNTVNHEQLILVMHKLSFPSVAISTVQDIYINACTKISTPAGDTDDIPIGRGTIQGDTLSPYLFLVFIEPLLRWLQHGGRGYALGGLGTTKSLKTVAALAYADDLNALTNDLSNLKLQAEKVGRFSNWSGMEVNAKKCAASAILHAQASAGPVKSPDQDAAV